MQINGLNLLPLVVAGVVWFGAGTLAYAVPPLEYNVIDFGAQCDDLNFDNTPSFQSALNAAANAGGGIVRVPHCRFRFDGNLIIGGGSPPLPQVAGVVLAGAGVGPYDPAFITAIPPTPQPTPATQTVAPTLLPKATSGEAFIRIVGSNSAVQDLLFFYPDQSRPWMNESVPVAYPPTIVVEQPAKISRCLFVNSFKAIDVRIGRVFLEMLHIGAFQNDIIIGNALDLVRISQVTASSFWDYGVVHPVPEPSLDDYALNHGTGIISFRADSLSIHDLNVHYRNVGISFFDTSPCQQIPPNGQVTYGKGSDIDLDGVKYGVVASATQPLAGFEFTNLSVGPAEWFGPTGQNMIWLGNCGGPTVEPRIVVQGGSTRGNWVKTLKVDGGILRVRDIVGLSPIGHLPALGISAPLIPASGIPYVSKLPAEARVTISNGNVTAIKIGGVSTGLTRGGMFFVSPGESITIEYSSPPTWEWFLN